MTTEIDLGRKLFGKGKASRTSSIRRGVTASASSEGLVSVLLDGSDVPVSLRCTGSYDAGQTVHVSNDGGVYSIMGDVGSNGADSFEETDPTVPDWAKQPDKPTYTASEVGALPASTHIPSKVSELSNDAGYLTGIPNEYVTDSEIASKDYATRSYVDSSTITTHRLAKQLSEQGWYRFAVVNVGADTGKPRSEVLRLIFGGKWESSYPRGFVVEAYVGCYQNGVFRQYPAQDDPAQITKVRMTTMGVNPNVFYFDAYYAPTIVNTVCLAIQTPFGTCEPIDFEPVSETSESGYVELALTKDGFLGALNTDNLSDYLPLNGGSLNDDASVKFTRYGNRFLTINGDCLDFDMSGVGGMWAVSLANLKDAKGVDRAMIGALGTKDDGLLYMFVGGDYANPHIKIEADGSVSFLGVPKANGSIMALKSEIPTNVSQLANDAGYLSAVPSEYVTESELSAKGYATQSAVNSAQTTANNAASAASAAQTAANSKAPAHTYGTADLTAGSSSLATGTLYLVYE